MTKDQSYEIKSFRRAHLEGALALSEAIGWPHRLRDWAMVLEMSQGLVALHDGQVVGTAIATPFGPNLATANMIIVDPAHQGKGLGRGLVQRVLPDAGACRLVATPEGLPLYEKLGFETTGDIRRHQGRLRAAPDPEAGVRPAQTADFSQVVALESANFGGDRSDVVRVLFEDGRVFVRARADGSLDGFAARRAFGPGHVIGPVVAPDLEAAQQVIAAAAAGLEGKILRIDTDPRVGLVPFIEALGLASAGGGTAMQRGTGPAGAPRAALFSQALG